MDLETVEKRSILKILAGSHIHGLAIPTSDRDEEAIVIEPIEEAMGLEAPFEELIREGKAGCERNGLWTGPPCSHGSTECGIRHEVDVKYVSLRKWCRLALKGNPNFLLPLFAPHENVLSMDARGSKLREMASSFISKQSIKSHLGYIQGQRYRMLSGSHGGRGKPRQDKIDQFGFDTKYAMHLLRLSLQGVELSQTGRISLPIPEPNRSYLLRVRAGEIPLDEVLKVADQLEADMKQSFDSSDLPDHPDYATVEEWMLKMYIRMWSADRVSKDIVEDKMKFGKGGVASLG